MSTQELLTMEPLQIWLLQLMIMACQGMAYLREIWSAKAEENIKNEFSRVLIYILSKNDSPLTALLSMPIIKIDLQTQT